PRADDGRPGGCRFDLPPPRPSRVAPDVRDRARLGGIRRGGGPAPGRAVAAGRGSPGRDARPSADVPAREPDRRRDRPPASERHSPERDRRGPASDDLPDHRGGRGGSGPPLVPRGARADPGRGRDGPRAVGIPRLADPRGSAWPGDARSPTRGPRPRPARRRRSGPVPPRPGPLSRGAPSARRRRRRGGAAPRKATPSLAPLAPGTAPVP